MIVINNKILTIKSYWNCLVKIKDYTNVLHVFLFFYDERKGFSTLIVIVVTLSVGRMLEVKGTNSIIYL